MIEIIKKLTPYNFSAMSNKKNEYIVIHYVGNVSTAKNNVEYFAKNKVNASAHYFVDEYSICQCVEDFNRAWHCGEAIQGINGHEFYGKCNNYNSIGIEMCVKKDNKGNWYFEEQTKNNTIDLVRYLMNKYNIPINNIIRHFDVTGKLCPMPLINNALWQEFKNLIISYEGNNEVCNCKNKMIYNYIDDNMPEYARPTIQKLVDKDLLRGDENGLNLNDEMLRMLVILDRAGVFDK